MEKVVLYAILCTLAPALCGAEDFHIVGLSAPLALNEFSRQADVQIMFDFTLVNEVSLNDVEGTMEPEALGAMLKDSGLEFELVNERTIAVMPVRPKPVDPATLAGWLMAFDDGPAMSYPYDDSRRRVAKLRMVLTDEGRRHYGR